MTDFNTGPWTQFADMHSGGGLKEGPYDYIYIQAPEDEAVKIFYNRFGHNPNRVSCTCCGGDYSIDESPTFRRASGFERDCVSLATPVNDEGRYQAPDDPWFRENYYLEPDQHDEAAERGYGLSKFGSYGKHQTVEEYIKNDDVLVITADEIKDSEREGDVPSQGYVWMD